VAGHKDYSGTPLWRKLGIGPGARVHLADPPPGFDDALEALAPLPDGVAFLRRPAKDLDVIVVGATRRAALERRFPVLVRSLAPAGRLWVAWPKKAARIDGDVDFAAVQELGLAAGLVDNKSASITADFQGMQFVVRLRDRARVR
jgi:hypothetical protein